jgi:hypothetical protein
MPCVLNVLAGNYPNTAANDPWIHRWEGWILGQAALPAADHQMSTGQAAAMANELLAASS